MTKVVLYNPYFEKKYKVVENKGDIERTLFNIGRGHEKFLHLHDFETGDPIIINPNNCACVEIEIE